MIGLLIRLAQFSCWRFDLSPSVFLHISNKDNSHKSAAISGLLAIINNFPAKYLGSDIITLQPARVIEAAVITNYLTRPGDGVSGFLADQISLGKVTRGRNV